MRKPVAERDCETEELTLPEGLTREFIVVMNRLTGGVRQEVQGTVMFADDTVISGDSK